MYLSAGFRAKIPPARFGADARSDRYPGCGSLDGPSELDAVPTGENSFQIRERVVAARKVQLGRFVRGKIHSNAEMNSDETKTFAKMSVSTERFAVSAAEKMQLSARGYYRMLKVARTIADLRAVNDSSKSVPVECSDIAEALRFRAFSGIDG